MDMTSSFDFHLHSCWSYDATAPVEYYFEMAEKTGAGYIAITEHNNMDSYPEAIEAAKKHPSVVYVPGAELTVYTELGTFDMVCLGMPGVPTPELQKIFDAYRGWQCDLGNAVSSGLAEAGFEYSEADRLNLLKKYRPERTIAKHGITHVQGELQADFLINGKKYFKNREELSAAFSKMRLPRYPSADEVLPAVKRTGALVFIAHPAGYFNNCDLARMDALRERLAFDGIECAHVLVSRELTAFYRNYCVKHNLLSSGGSDTHSRPDDVPGFGKNHKFAGHIAPERFLEEIKERLKNIPEL